jgi:hypothetical protein
MQWRQRISKTNAVSSMASLWTDPVPGVHRRDIGQRPVGMVQRWRVAGSPSLFSMGPRGGHPTQCPSKL